MDVSSKTAEDLEKILESLEIEKDENNAETLKVECKVNEERSSFETDKINVLEGKVISAESRILLIEKESVERALRLENVEKCAKIEDKELDDIRKQLEEVGIMEKTEERFCKLEDFNSDLKEKFINLLEVCEGFQSELEEIKKNNIHPKKPSEDKTFEGSRFPPQLYPNPARSQDAPLSPSANTASSSKSSPMTLNRSTSCLRVSVSKSKPPSNVVGLFQSQSTPESVYVHNTTALSTKPNCPTTTSLFPLYNWKFPVDQQVAFGPIPASVDDNGFYHVVQKSDLTYQTLRSAFQKLGQVCDMLIGKTVASDPVTGDLVKFGYVVFVDKLSAEKAVKIGKIVTSDGCEVLLKEVPKPWLAT